MGMTIMVTGAGGPAGVAVLRAIAAQGHRTVAVDCDPRGVGLRIADEGAVVAPYGAATYGSDLVDLALRTGANVLISTLAEEMGALRAVVGELEAAGTAVWLPPQDAVDTCVDKWAFAQFLVDAGLPGPATGLGVADDVNGPWIVKPRFGRGSRDVVAVDDADELRWALRRVPDPVVQTRLQGTEFTVDVLADRVSTVLAAVPRWRTETKAGISTKGTTFVHDGVAGLVARLMAALRYEGPANVQGFVLPDGGVALVEVNPRFSGGLPLSLASGSDLVGQYVRLATGLPPEPEHLAFRPGVSMMRYFVEVFE